MPFQLALTWFTEFSTDRNRRFLSAPFIHPQKKGVKRTDQRAGPSSNSSISYDNKSLFFSLQRNLQVKRRGPRLRRFNGRRVSDRDRSARPFAGKA